MECSPAPYRSCGRAPHGTCALSFRFLFSVFIFIHLFFIFIFYCRFLLWPAPCRFGFYSRFLLLFIYFLHLFFILGFYSDLRLVVPVAEHGVAAQLLLEAAPLVAVHPAEDLRVGGRGAAEGDAVRPVLREPVLPGDRVKARPADGHLGKSHFVTGDTQNNVIPFKLPGKKWLCYKGHTK